MKNRLAVLSSNFPYYLNDEKRNTLMIAGISVFLAVFMTVFPAKHFAEFPKIVVASASTFLVLFISIQFFPKLFPKTFNSGTWTLWRHLVFNVLQIAAIGLLISTVVYVLNFYPNLTYLEILVCACPKVLAYGTVPVLIKTLLIKNEMLRDDLERATRANQKLREIRELNGDAKESEMVTVHSDTSETLRLNVRDLLFVEANGNYSIFFWKNAGKIEKKMLRMNLKTVESQVQNPYTMRCHHSYVVNIHVIESLTGNTNGYKASIADSDHSIPVSRSKGKLVMEKIDQIRRLVV